MLQELFNAIGEQAVRAARPDFVEHGVTIGRRQEDGTLFWSRSVPEPRNHVSGSIETICKLACEVGVESHEETDGKASLWYSRTGVVLLFDDDDRRDVASMPLACSKQMMTMMQMESNIRPISQKDLIFMLRTVFKSCLGPAGDIIAVIRNMRAQMATDQASELQHGKTSVGKAMRAEITGTAAIPEYVTFSVPVFESRFLFSSNVECALEPDPATMTFRLVPVTGEIEKAIAAGERAICEALTESAGETPVYFGHPVADKPIAF